MLVISLLPTQRSKVVRWLMNSDEMSLRLVRFGPLDLRALDPIFSLIPPRVAKGVNYLLEIKESSVRNEYVEPGSISWMLFSMLMQFTLVWDKSCPLPVVSAFHH
jgi:hypothetical protein